MIYLVGAVATYIKVKFNIIDLIVIQSYDCNYKIIIKNCNYNAFSTVNNYTSRDLYKYKFKTEMRKTNHTSSDPLSLKIRT